MKPDRWGQHSTRKRLTRAVGVLNLSAYFHCPRAFAARACLSGNCTSPGSALGLSDGFRGKRGAGYLLRPAYVRRVLAFHRQRAARGVSLRRARNAIPSGSSRWCRSGRSNPPRRQDRSGSRHRQSHHHLPSWGLCCLAFVRSWPALELRSVRMGSAQPWAHRTLYSCRMHSSGTNVGYPNLRPRARSTGPVNGSGYCASDLARVDSHRNTKSRSRARRARQSFV